MESQDQLQNVSEKEEPKKRKSRFGIVIGVVIVLLAIVFSFLTLSQKEKYEVLDSSSKEVSSRIHSIKDIRTLKGYKVIEENGNNKLVLISAGLSYDPDGTIEVLNVEFGKGSAKITIKEQINQNPEKEKVTYPFLIVKLSSEITNISVITETGENYEEISLNQHTNEGPVEESENVEVDEELSEELSEEVVEEEVVEEDVVKSESEEDNVQTKTITCIYEGKADATTIEISIGDEYKTFDISDVVRSFDSMEIGKQITIEYIDTLGNGKVVSVK